MPEKLEPGTHSVAKATPRRAPDGGWYLNYRVCFRDGTLSPSKRVKARTVGEARRIARQRAESLLQTDGDSTYYLTDRVTKFLDAEVKPTIESKKSLSPRTRERYLLSFAHIRKYSTGMTLVSFTKPKSLKTLLATISDKVGHESARQARNVLSAYVITGMRDHGLLDHNPLYGLTIEATQTQTRAKETLTPSEWRTVVDWLLDTDKPDTPMPGKTSPASNKKDAIERHNRVRDLTLLQATTGARSVEALDLRWSRVTKDKDGHVWVELHGKTKMGRTVPILDKRVAEHFWDKRQRSGLVISAPADPTKTWERSLANKAVREYYKEIANATGVEKLKTERSHVWRGTLNTVTAGTLPPHIRAAYFGHTEEVNAQSYTTAVDVRPMLDAVEKL